jgi:hypothetical protein
MGAVTENGLNGLRMTTFVLADQTISVFIMISPTGNDL